MVWEGAGRLIAKRHQPATFRYASIPHDVNVCELSSACGRFSGFGSDRHAWLKTSSWSTWRNGGAKAQYGSERRGFVLL